jgi:hypothetical protein
MPYLYRIVACGTPGCRTLIDYCYHGEVESSGEVVTFSTVGVFELGCPVCGEHRTYTDDDLKPEFRDHAPRAHTS